MADKTYKVGESIYDIPEQESRAFLKDFPDAVEIETFTVGKDTFDIPTKERELFLKDYPEAQPIKKKVSPIELAAKGETMLQELGLPSKEPVTPQQQLPSELQTPDLTLKTPQTIIGEQPDYISRGEKVERPTQYAKTLGEWITGAVGIFDRKVASVFDGLDYIHTSTSDAANQILLGKETANEIKKMREDGTLIPSINPARPFEALSNAINWMASGAKPLPIDTKAQRIGGGAIGGVMGVIPDILATILLPEIKTAQAIQKFVPSLSKFGVVIGS